MIVVVVLVVLLVRVDKDGVTEILNAQMSGVGHKSPSGRHARILL